jgi:hypothetical protein
MYCSCGHITTHTEYSDEIGDRNCPACNKKLKEDFMDVQQILETSIGDLKIKLLLYKTGLTQAKTQDTIDTLKFYIASTEAELALLEKELVARKLKQEKSDERTAKRSSRTK